MGCLGRVGAGARLFATKTGPSVSLSDVLDSLAPTVAKFNVSFRFLKWLC